MAHPRVSGENQPGQVLTLADLGSSPRERGKHAETFKSVGMVRLIPA